MQSGKYLFTESGLQSVAASPQPPQLESLLRLSPSHPLFNWIAKLPSTHIHNTELLHFIIQRHPLLFAIDRPLSGISGIHQHLIRGLLNAYAELAHSIAFQHSQYLNADAAQPQPRASTDLPDFDVCSWSGRSFAGFSASQGSPQDSSFLDDVFRFSP